MRLTVDWGTEDPVATEPIPAKLVKQDRVGGETSAFERVMAPDRTTAGIECGIGGRFADRRPGDGELRLENHPETGSSKLHLRLGFARHSRNFGCYGRSGPSLYIADPAVSFPSK